MKKNTSNTLEQMIDDLVCQYFENIGDHCKNTQSTLYKELTSRVEKQLILSVLNKTQHNQCQTASLLGISRTTLRKKILDYGLI